jgi:hypothetical protein
MKSCLLIIFILLTSCIKVDPDFTKDGHDYIIREVCKSSHIESKYGMHYGYSIMHGGFCWHVGQYTETVCDSSSIDTIEVNIK